MSELPTASLAAQQVSRRLRWIMAGGIVAGLAIVALVIVCGFFWSQYRAVYSWRYKPSEAELWSSILNSNSDTDIVLSDTSYGLAESLSGREFPLSDYLSRSYVSQIQVANLSPDMHAALDRILRWDLVNPDESKLARRILALDPLGKHLHLYDSNNYMPDLITRDNVILIGARMSNPWDELFDNRINFIPDFDGPRVTNRAPASGEPHVYNFSGSDGYCVVAYLPAQTHKGIVLLIQGTGAEATEAAGNFLLSEDQLTSFKKKLHMNKLPFFEVLLKVSSVKGTPLTATIAAYRIYPNP